MINKTVGLLKKPYIKQRSTSHDTAVSNAVWTIAVKHWKTAGIRFGVLRYSKTQLKALLEAFKLAPPPLSMPPLLLNRIISKKATARR